MELAGACIFQFVFNCVREELWMYFQVETDVREFIFKKLEELDASVFRGIERSVNESNFMYASLLCRSQFFPDLLDVLVSGDSSGACAVWQPKGQPLDVSIWTKGLSVRKKGLARGVGAVVQSW